MTFEDNPALEQALIKLINAEMAVMRSFCEQQFPCDLSTTIAMRMSRSIVSAICSAVGEEYEKNQIVSTDTSEIMQAATIQLEHLTELFEKRLMALADNQTEWKAWTV